MYAVRLVSVEMCGLGFFNFKKLDDEVESSIVFHQYICLNLINYLHVLGVCFAIPPSNAVAGFKQFRQK